jgi:ABC-2 type transport system permease protein
VKEYLPQIVRLFVTFVAMGFRRWSAYRLAAAAGAFTNSVFGLIRAAVTGAAVGAAGGTLAGYDQNSAATYVWIVQALIAPLSFFGWNELALRVRTGDVAIDLARPVDPQFAYLAADLGRAAFTLIPRGAPPLIVGAVVTGLTLPGTPLPYVLAALSIAAAAILSFAGWWLVNLAAFWLLDLRGPRTLYAIAANLLSGFLVPVHWFPGWLDTIATWSPFPSMLQTPVDIVMARATGLEALGLIAMQCAWVAALLALGRVIFRLGARRLVVQGG